MPRIPQIQSQVQENIVSPTVRAQNNFDPESINAGQSSRILDNQVISFLREQKENASQVRLAKAQSDLQSRKNRLLHDPDSGALSQRGENAITSYSDFMKRFDDEADEVSKTLTREQKVRFNGIRESQKSSLDSSLSRHIFNEQRSLDEMVTQEALGSAIEDAILNYSDYGHVNSSIETIKELIDSSGARNGLPKEIVSNQKKEAISNVHAKVIENMMNGGDSQTAREYFEMAKKNMSLSDQDGVQKVLDKDSFIATAQQETDRIMSSETNLLESLKEARRFENPELRDEVVKRVKARFQEMKQFERDDFDRTYLEAEAMILENPNVAPTDIVPASILSKMTASQQKSLFSINNPPDKTSVTKFDEFISMPVEQIAKMNISEFKTKYWMNFSETDRNYALNIFQKSKESPDEVVSIQSLDNRIKNGLRAIGKYRLDPSKEDKKRFIEFKNNIENQLRSFQVANGGKEPNQSEIEKVLNDELMKEVVVRKFFKDKKTISSLVSEKERDDVFIPFSSLSDEDINAIDSKFKGIIKRSLKRKDYEIIAGMAELPNITIDEILEVIDG